KHLQQIELALNIEGFSESQTRDLSRAMQQVVRARRQLDEAQRALTALEEGENLGYYQADARGFELDTLSLYQLEHSLGLNLNQYRAAFEQRKVLADNLQRALRDKAELEQKKIDAARKRDQMAIDRLLPGLAVKETEVHELTEQLDRIRSTLSELAADYEKRLGKVRAFREELAPRIKNTAEELAKIHESLIENDMHLNTLAISLLPDADQAFTSIRAFGIDDLAQVDKLIDRCSKELAYLKEARSLKQEEHYYKTKALWLLCDIFYRQSLINDFGALTASNTISTDTLEDEKRHGLFPYEEYDPSSLYTQGIITDVIVKDGNQANFEAWIDALEGTALQLVQEGLPLYACDNISQPEWLSKESADLVADLNTFISRARFLAGEVHMKRAIRFMRSEVCPVQENQQVQHELTAATNSFLHFLDFALPLESHPNANELLSEANFASADFPETGRHPVRLVSQAQVYLGSAALLRGNNHEAIAHFRKLLQENANEVGSSDSTDRWISDPLLASQTQFQNTMHPLYASLLGHSPVAHEAVYRLGKAYEALQQQELAIGIYESSFHPEHGKEHEERANSYARMAIAYYSQLILTQSYSPFRSAALLKRGLLHRELGNYEDARADLVAILGSPEDTGGSWSPTSRTEKGDLPGELDPGYAHVAFELGKLHLDQGNYIAAADAFLQAREGDPED
ncbi:MAG: tetratricopeptide repeat protein, partial [Chlamydiia bacterium]|nr:tetratricopeptide repeat protein [Chlamydiia bacterium]